MRVPNTVDKKSAFRDSFRHRRCLVPATEFYEWHKVGDHKQLYNTRATGRELFAFAVLWDRWQKPDGEPLRAYTIIVTDANKTLRPNHDRMPVILDPTDYEVWLNPQQQDTAALKALFQPLPFDRVEFSAGESEHGQPCK